MIRVAVPLALGAVAVGLWLGSPRSLDASAAIDRAADHHAAVTGGARSDCTAQPSTLAGLALIVTCDGDGGRHLYHIDSRGRLIDRPATEGRGA